MPVEDSDRPRKRSSSGSSGSRSGSGSSSGSRSSSSKSGSGSSKSGSSSNKSRSGSSKSSSSRSGEHRSSGSKSGSSHGESRSKGSSSSGRTGSSSSGSSRRSTGSSSNRSGSSRPSSSGGGSSSSHRSRSSSGSHGPSSGSHRPSGGSGSRTGSGSRSGSRSGSTGHASDRHRSGSSKSSGRLKEKSADQDGALLTEDELLESTKSDKKPEREGVSWILLGSRSPDSEDEKDISSWKRGRLIRQGIAGLLVLALLVTLGYTGYKRFINPDALVVPAQYTGSASIEEFQNNVNNTDDDALANQLDPTYIGQELDYANLSQPRQDFVRAVNSTVKYEIPQVQSTSIYGTGMKKHGQPLMQKSYMLNGEMVDLTTVDWSKILVDAPTVQALMKDASIDPADPDIQVKLTDLYASYIVSLSKEKAGLPLKVQKWQPAMTYDTVEIDGKQTPTAAVSPEEDAALDNELFSSKPFLTSLTEFSKAATGAEPSPEWTSYLESKDENALRPAVGNTKFIDPTWVGAWWNLTGIVENAKANDKTATPIKPAVGDGTREAPAGMNTSVVTAMLVKAEDGSTVAKPIRIELIDFRKDEDAFEYFQSKDARNRGFSTQSQIKYASMQFKITNISDTELTIPVNATLADDQGNVINSTGSVFGMTNEVALKPGESGIVDTWVGNTNLSEIYLVWGRDFNKAQPVVWFKVLGAADGGITPTTDTGKLDESGNAVTGASDNGGADG